ncbi:MAG: DUF4830 domain-containing protein [Clostridia bacterium]|nr:DUF4830 domain-containing protein [Clostridia bacterium]
MRLFSVLTKKSLLVILFALVLTLCFVSKFSTLANAKTDGATRKQRTEFLRNLGCFVNAESETKKEIVIPEVFSDVYKNYNLIQNQAGYDLDLYKGCRCYMFSYDVNELSDGVDPKYFKANVIVYKGRIIGGDISSAELDGVMFPLVKRDEKTKIRQVYFDPAQFTESYV